jgi:hypothetical protein
MSVKSYFVKWLNWGELAAPLLIFFLSSPFFLSDLEASTSTVRETQSSKERFAALGSSREWKRILFYQKSLFGFESGMVDSDSFYLSRNGNRDPVAELEVTHDVLRRKGYRVPKLDLPAACAFPARLDFLLRKNLIKLDDIPERDCPELEAWLSERKYESMWLVFSSWYPANPASMYGHTFLRFRRTDRDSDLLDDAVNFAANVDQFSGLTYVFKGLMGGFPGRFSMMPYHLKINEYNNVESRDLWEYRVSTSPEQIRRVMLSLIEFAPHFFDYFYLDENCSWAILKVLETGDPSWDFMPDFKFWVVPIDTVKWVVSDLGTNVAQKNRISMQQRFLQRYEMLDANSKKAVRDVINKMHQGLSADLANAKLAGGLQDQVQRRRALDALLDWVDYQDAAGTENRQDISQLRKVLFKLRAANPGAPDALEELPASSNPLNGHGSTHARLGIVRQPDARFYPAFSWTPALHELLGPTTGYARGLEISMFRMGLWLDHRKHDVVVNDLGFVGVRALNPWTETERPASWFVDLGYTTDHICPHTSRGCQKSSVSFGRGLTKSLPFGAYFNDVYAAAFVFGETGRLRRRDDKDTLFVGAGPRFNLWYGDDNFRFTYNFTAQRLADQQRILETKWQHNVAVGVSLNQRADLRFSFTEDSHLLKGATHKGRSFSIMGGIYF